MTNKLSDKDKKDWQKFLDSSDKLYNKDFHQANNHIISERTIDLHGYTLEDANKSNGCLQVASGGHRGPLRKLFKKIDGKMQMLNINNEEFPETDTFVEVKKGSLVLLHGRLPHYSCENTSPNSRHAYTIHVIDQNNDYPDWNWLQRPNLPLKSFIND